jgi:hypothetical protein
MLFTVPLELAEANAFVKQHHRHHFEVQGHRFSIGAINEAGILVGVATVGRPVSRGCPPWLIAEVTRCCTDGTKNACSFLYGACARAARAIGFIKIQTYLLDVEVGTSLKAAGWWFEAYTTGGSWNTKTSPNRREDQPMCPKGRWIKLLNDRPEMRPLPGIKRKLPPMVDYLAGPDYMVGMFE